VVLVTTIDEEGVENVAPKSLISMFSFDPPILGIGCNLEHRTAKNILTTGEFTVNVPHHDLAPTVWRASEMPHPRRIGDIGLTSIPSLKVRAPRIEECNAHFECKLDSFKAWGREVALFGEIISFTRDADLGATWEDWYSRLGLIVYLEEGLYGVIEARSL
jgi:flavin reductase (DIM6/NTAB) family NADH-FMN oxidoreductase RutF